MGNIDLVSASRSVGTCACGGDDWRAGEGGFKTVAEVGTHHARIEAGDRVAFGELRRYILTVCLCQIVGGHGQRRAHGKDVARARLRD